MTSHSLKALEPWLVPYAEWLVWAAPYAGARSVRVTSVWRSRAQQQALYLRYLRGESRFPAAPPGLSKHGSRRAFDMVTEPFWVLDILGGWWKELGGQWFPSDRIHFQA